MLRVKNDGGIHIINHVADAHHCRIFLTHICLLCGFGLSIVGDGSNQAANANADENKSNRSFIDFIRFILFTNIHQRKFDLPGIMAGSPDQGDATGSGQSQPAEDRGHQPQHQRHGATDYSVAAAGTTVGDGQNKPERRNAGVSSAAPSPTERRECVSPPARRSRAPRGRTG
jgi:hypothetical protein